MDYPAIIAIDGPAASGKSTLGVRLAKHLDYLYFDTGVMYRAVTLAALQQNIPIGDETGCVHLADEIKIDVMPATVDDGRLSDVLLDGKDVTWAIRQADVDANVSLVSTYPGVREALSAKQRRVGMRGKVVMVGRDIGTVVLPEANIKIYLNASVEERAQRRYQECIARGDDVTYEEILASMRQRDEIDSTRDIAPLRPAKDAIVLRSDDLTSDDVFAKVKRLVEQFEFKPEAGKS